jgi:hypothetical protein
LWIVDCCQLPLGLCSHQKHSSSKYRWIGTCSVGLANLGKLSHHPSKKRKKTPGNTKGGIITVLLTSCLTGLVGLVCFANKNKNCKLSFSWFQTSQTGGQWYSVTSPFSIPRRHCPRSQGNEALWPTKWQYQSQA